MMMIMMLLLKKVMAFYNKTVRKCEEKKANRKERERGRMCKQENEIAKRRRVRSTLSKCPSYISYRKKNNMDEKKEER
jgi:hypothetical protein